MLTSASSSSITDVSVRPPSSLRSTVERILPAVPREDTRTHSTSGLAGLTDSSFKSYAPWSHQGND
ncbi:hypothetical protein [Archangium sp.]|jgi:hypothetical protein|uniref:hypothetical protein n=1 Tax=Archangium sp. TaxID=1872627 RepID=UPI002EDB84E7